MIILCEKNLTKMLFIIFCATSLVAQSASTPRNKMTAACVMAATVAIGARGAIENHPEYHGILKYYPVIFATALAGVIFLDRLRTGDWYLLREFKAALSFSQDATRAIAYEPSVNTEYACGEDEDFFGSDDDGDGECSGGCCCH